MDIETLIQKSTNLLAHFEDEKFSQENISKIRDLSSYLNRFVTKFHSNYDFLNISILNERLSSKTIKSINLINKEVKIDF